jgi:hypothetical protein
MDSQPRSRADTTLLTCCFQWFGWRGGNAGFSSPFHTLSRPRSKENERNDEPTMWSGGMLIRPLQTEDKMPKRWCLVRGRYLENTIRMYEAVCRLEVPMTYVVAMHLREPGRQIDQRRDDEVLRKWFASSRHARDQARQVPQLQRQRNARSGQEETESTAG